MAEKSNIDKQASSGDVIAEATGERGKAKAETGRVYTGTIVKTDYGRGLYTVRLDGIENAVEGCQWAAGGIFAPFLGYKISHFPELNSRVALLYGRKSFIISCIPCTNRDDVSGKGRTMTSTGLGRGDAETGTDRRGIRHTMPADMLEGEFEIANLLGCGVQFLTNLVKISGSERAKVETHLLNDMVRIVSDTFKHHSALGDFQIYNDGRLNARWDGTSYEHEAEGILDPNSPKADLDNRKVTFGDITKTARWRFSQYLGWLGDFFHVIITDPTQVISNIAEDALRPGKARVQFMNDGSFLMQSVSEISVERVCRVIQPIENKRYDDPEGTHRDAFDDLDDSFLEDWDWGPDLTNAHECGYKLRQYARWFSCFRSYQRFHQMEAADEEWVVPREDNPNCTHEWTGKEEDKEGKNQGKPTLFDTYACWRIFRDGSILFMDGYGSAIHMVKGNIQIGASRHLELTAAGDIRIDAGNDIYIKARRNVDIAAVVGGIILKARTWFKALCEWGTIWLKSDAVDKTKEDPPTPVGEFDPKPEVRDAAILLDATKGKTFIQSERQLNLQVLGKADAPGDHTDETASVVIQSKNQDVRVFGKRSAIIRAEGNNEGVASLDSNKSVLIRSSDEFLVSATSLIDFNNYLTIRPSGIHADRIYANQLFGISGVYAPENEQGQGPHGQHVYKVPDSAEVNKATAAEREAMTTYETYYDEVSWKTPHLGDKGNGPTWRFYEDYDWASGGIIDSLYEPITHQYIRNNSSISDNYSDWTWEDDKLKSSSRTDGNSRPYPGKLTHKTNDDGEPLYEPLAQDYSAQDPSINTEMTDSSIVRKFLKK